MKRASWIIVGVAMATLAVDGYSAWGSFSSSSCLIRSLPMFAAVDSDYKPGDKYEWQRDTYYTNQSFLLRNGVRVGGWRHDTKSYCQWTGTGWGKFCKPPIDPPTDGIGATTNKVLTNWQTHGVERSKCNESNKETFTLSGQVIDAGQAFAAVGDNQLVDDSDKLHLIVITKSADTRAKILADYATLPKDFRDHTNVWAAPPDHFSMMDRSTGKPRFVADQDPTIILEDANGVVLCRHPHDATSKGYQGLADLTLLLKSDPNYKASADPGLPTKSTLTEPSEIEIAVAVALAVIGIVLLLVMFRRK